MKSVPNIVVNHTAIAPEAKKTTSLATKVMKKKSELIEQDSISAVQGMLVEKQIAREVNRKTIKRTKGIWAAADQLLTDDVTSKEEAALARQLS